MTSQHSMPTEPRRLALAAALAAGVRIEVLDAVEELERAAAIVNTTWPQEVSISMLRALRKAGNYVCGAWRGDELVGACLGFFGWDGRVALHSHLAVTDQRFRATGIGVALKLHQRAWALEGGVEHIYWTYDPLQRPNAHVNLNKLGAAPVEYLENFYGDNGDNGELPFPTDRLMVRWSLRSGAVAAAAEGRYRVPELDRLRRAGCVTLLGGDTHGRPVECHDDGAAHALIGTPVDATALRRMDPALALDWLLLVRGHVQAALASGTRITGFSREGFYVLDRTPSVILTEEPHGSVPSTRGTHDE